MSKNENSLIAQRNVDSVSVQCEENHKTVFKDAELDNLHFLYRYT